MSKRSTALGSKHEKVQARTPREKISAHLEAESQAASKIKRSGSNLDESHLLLLRMEELNKKIEDSEKRLNNARKVFSGDFREIESKYFKKELDYEKLAEMKIKLEEEKNMLEQALQELDDNILTIDQDIKATEANTKDIKAQINSLYNQLEENDIKRQEYRRLRRKVRKLREQRMIEIQQRKEVLNIKPKAPKQERIDCKYELEFLWKEYQRVLEVQNDAIDAVKHNNSIDYLKEINLVE